MRMGFRSMFLLGLVLVAGYALLVRLGTIPSLRQLFSPAPVLIDETPVLIREIRQISEMVTITAFDEVVVSSYKAAPAGSARQLIQMVAPAPVLAMDRLVLVVRGRVLVGTDLRQLGQQDIYITGDSISMRVPAARILDIIVNPSDTETFIENGNWSAAESARVKQQAREKLGSRAVEKGLLKKADEQSLQVIHHFLRMLGFRKIRLVTRS